jgi:hypothetical protein
MMPSLIRSGLFLCVSEQPVLLNEANRIIINPWDLATMFTTGTESQIAHSQFLNVTRTGSLMLNNPAVV